MAAVLFAGLFSGSWASPAFGDDNALRDFLIAPNDNVKRTSKPVFDPELFKKEKNEPLDPFFDKIRKTRSGFSEKELKWKQETFRKIKDQNLPDEERQKKFVEFRKEEIARELKFNRKEKKKINKHLRKEKNKHG